MLGRPPSSAASSTGSRPFGRPPNQPARLLRPRRAMALWLELTCPPLPQVPPMPDAPVLLIVDDDPRARGVVERELRKRYGADYQVICLGSADAPLRLLAKLRDDRRLVGIVLAGQSMSQTTGVELLARVGE